MFRRQPSATRSDPLRPSRRSSDLRGEAQEEHVGEAVHVGAVLRAHAVGPVLRQLHAVAPGYVVARSAGVVGADLEPRRVDDAVELVLLAGYHDAPLGDPLHTLAVGVDEVRAGLVERLQVLVVEARSLSEMAVPGLEPLRRGRVLDDGVDPRADLLP